MNYCEKFGWLRTIMPSIQLSMYKFENFNFIYFISFSFLVISLALVIYAIQRNYLKEERVLLLGRVLLNRTRAAPGRHVDHELGNCVVWHCDVHGNAGTFLKAARVHFVAKLTVAGLGCWARCWARCWGCECGRVENAKS